METIKAIIEVLVVIIGYTVVAPLIGAIIMNRPKAKRFFLGLMVFMTCWFPNKITTMIYSIEWYRGHTKGFEFTLLEVVALGLIWGSIFTRGKKTKIFTIGAVVYTAYCLGSMVSVFDAYVSLMVWMAFAKFAKVLFVFIAVYNAVDDDDDIWAVLWGMWLALVISGLVALKMRYIDGRFQVPAWFEHQNSMATWAYMCGLVLLGSGLCFHLSNTRSFAMLIGFAAAAGLVVFSVSRASLVAVSLGAVLMVPSSFMIKIGFRKLFILVLMGVGGTMAAMVAMDTIVYRFQTAGDQSKINNLRYILDEQSAEMFKDNLFGVGWNNYGVAASKFGPELLAEFGGDLDLAREHYSNILEKWDVERGMNVPEMFYAHNPLTENLYWLTLAETGLWGAIPFFLFLFLSWWYAIRSAWIYRGTFAGYVLFGIAGALSITYLHGGWERVLTQTKNLAMWLTLVAIVFKLYAKRKELKAEREKQLSAVKKASRSSMFLGKGRRRRVPPVGEGLLGS